jgi:hypothetical protein
MPDCRAHPFQSCDVLPALTPECNLRHEDASRTTDGAGTVHPKD